jgi:hypothetical protein
MSVPGVLALLERTLAVGPPDEEYMGGHLCLRLRGTHRGLPVRAFLITHHQMPIQLRLGVSLGARPIKLLVNHRRNTFMPGVPEVRAGDAPFDQLFLVNGFPVSVLQETLDPATRGWLLERFAKREPTLKTEGGDLTLALPLARGPAFETILPSPEELTDWLDKLAAVRARLVAAFDAERVRIEQNRGPAAAEEWARQLGASAAARSGARVGVVMAIAGGVVLTVVAALIALLWAFR